MNNGVIVGIKTNKVSMDSYEWLINDNGEVLVFNNEFEAIAYLIERGLTQKEINMLEFFKYKRCKKA